MTFVREEENGNNGHHAGGRIDSGSRAGPGDSSAPILGMPESPRRLHASGGADFGIRPPRRKAQSFRTHRGHHEPNQSRSSVISARGQEHEPHEHASESAGIASSVTIDARVVALIYTGIIRRRCLLFILLSPAHPAERGRR